MPPPTRPKIYHILHVDRLSSVIADGCLLSDSQVAERDRKGTVIGMNQIKQRRLVLPLTSRPGLHVGDCVPFYFCPRSVMLFMIYRRNAELAYQGGQEHIVHLEFDLHKVVAWANAEPRQWAFTLSNAGAYAFEDRCDLAQLSEVDWAAVSARQWAGPGVPSSVKQGKQAEFLVERSVPWTLVERIGISQATISNDIGHAMANATHRPVVERLPDWYY